MMQGWVSFRYTAQEEICGVSEELKSPALKTKTLKYWIQEMNCVLSEI
jgi:hypothetical protein